MVLGRYGIFDILKTREPMIQYLRRPLGFAVAVALTGCVGATGPKPSASAPAGTDLLDPASLDRAADPCADFYTFVNGKWVAANPVPADRTRWGTFDELREGSLKAQHAIIEDPRVTGAASGTIERKLADFYASGMDEAAIEQAGVAPIAPLLKRIAAIRNVADLTAYFADAHAQGLPGYFGFGGGADYKNSEMTIAFAREGGIGLPERAYYLEDRPDYVRIRGEYVAHIEKTLALAAVKADEAKKNAQWILALETRNAKASLTPIERRDPQNRYNMVSVAEANKITPHLDWNKFITAQGVNGVENFSMGHPSWFGEFDKSLTEVPIEHWKAYLRFHTIEGFSPYLGKGFVEEQFDFRGHKLLGQKEMEPRWKRVLGTVNEEMGMAMGQLYVAKEFPPESKLRAEELVANMRAALGKRIDKLDWMGPETKNKAREKLAAFTPKIGYPDKWRDWSGLSVAQSGYVANVQAASKLNQAWRMAKIGKPVDKREWGMTPQTVNAYYSSSTNDIVFPAAILQPPFFLAKGDDALNYGGIGGVIGHEMSHGFDDQGSKFDAKGNNVNWWADTDRKQFEARTDKLVKQFDDYVALEDLHVKGKLTLGENIGDLGGLNTAWDALQMALAKNPAEAKSKMDGLTQAQRFFINWATVWRTNTLPAQAKVLLNTDPHAPGKFRAIATPSNMPAFAQAFACRAGTPMVRGGEAQVKIW